MSSFEWIDYLNKEWLELLCCQLLLICYLCWSFPFLSPPSFSIYILLVFASNLHAICCVWKLNDFPIDHNICEHTKIQMFWPMFNLTMWCFHYSKLKHPFCDAVETGSLSTYQASWSQALTVSEANHPPFTMLPANTGAPYPVHFAFYSNSQCAAVPLVHI